MTIHLTDDELREITGFAAITGMRQGDILALRVSAAGPDGITYRSGKAGKLQLVRWSDALRRVWQEATQDRIGASREFRNFKLRHYLLFRAVATIFRR